MKGVNMGEVDRHKIEVRIVVTNSEGKETAGAELFLGEMKIEDVKCAEKELLEKIPAIFLGMLAKF